VQVREVVVVGSAVSSQSPPPPPASLQLVVACIARRGAALALVGLWWALLSLVGVRNVLLVSKFSLVT
jgi:hypothetical protein